MKDCNIGDSSERDINSTSYDTLREVVLSSLIIEINEPRSQVWNDKYFDVGANTHPVR